jgi:hypothetical protein
VNLLGVNVGLTEFAAFFEVGGDLGHDLVYGILGMAA